MAKHPAEVFGHPHSKPISHEKTENRRGAGGIRLKVEGSFGFSLQPSTYPLYSVKMGKLHTKCRSTLGCGS